MAAPDVMKILKDLEYRAVGVDPNTQQKQTGSYVSFRQIGLPIRAQDYSNPWTPSGGEMTKILNQAAKSFNANNPNKPASNPDGTSNVDVTPPSASFTVDALAAAGVGQSIENFASTFFLTNNKISLNSNYYENLSAGKVHDAWYAIVNGAQAVASKMEVKPEIQHVIDQNMLKLQDDQGNQTPHFVAYNNYRDAYNQKVQALNRAFADAQGNPTDYHMWPIRKVLHGRCELCISTMEWPRLQG